MMSETTMGVPLQATTKTGVLKQLVKVAEQSWQVYDGAAIFEAIKTREDMASTGLETGVAIPHPRRPLPNAIEESIIVFGRTINPIPFGIPAAV